MTTALKIINRALQKLGVKKAGVPLTDDEVSDAIIELNDLMLELDADGTKLNYTVISDSSDIITAPDWSYSYMTSNLAVRLAPDFDISASAELVAQATTAELVVIKRTSEIGPVVYPNTLPIGSGNESMYDERFFIETNKYDLETGSGDQLSDNTDFHIQED